ncbi:hypothetical protein CDAR_395691 [Caerostris darwini]|uniref:Uncharacterized protein n=1 Tax=Caerostris darwini TaxID=1538125 RepID=A0AAV4QQ89_9ARAC|nr:hypothetical protein CDAR_395691 [Caerostris darwini]
MAQVLTRNSLLMHLIAWNKNMNESDKNFIRTNLLLFRDEQILNQLQGNNDTKPKTMTLEAGNTEKHRSDYNRRRVQMSIQTPRSVKNELKENGFPQKIISVHHG